MPPAPPVTVGAFLATLKTNMAARFAASGTLNDVKTYIVAPPAEEEPMSNLLVLVRDRMLERDDLANATRTRKRDQTVTIPGAVKAYGTSKTGGDSAFQIAMDRAAAILDELIYELRDNVPQVGQQTRSGLVTAVSWMPYAVEKGGWIVRGDYTLTYSTRVS